MVKVIISLFLFFLGSAFASFFGVVCSRVPKNKSIVKPGSHCDSCDHSLAWYENIPVFSYIFLGGKCKSCKARIPFSSLLYELLGGLSLLFIYLLKGITAESILMMVIALLMLLCAGYDYATNTILDFMWLGLAAFIIALFIVRITYYKEEAIPYVLSLVIGSIIFIVIKLIGVVFLKKDILGTGDIIVFGVSCILFNPIGVLLSLVAGCVPGAIIEVIKLKKKEISKETEICFLPYLCFGLYIAMLLTPYALNYLGW